MEVGLKSKVHQNESIGLLLFAFRTTTEEAVENTEIVRQIGGGALQLALIRHQLTEEAVEGLELWCVFVFFKSLVYKSWNRLCVLSEQLVF